MALSGVILGKNPKIFKPRQIIYQNEALGALREAKKKRLVHQLPRAKREAEKKRTFHQ